MHNGAMQIGRLTWEQGMEIQREHLNEWKQVLTAEAYEALVDEAVKENITRLDYCERMEIDDHRRGFEVWRGTMMDQFIGNYAKRQIT